MAKSMKPGGGGRFDKMVSGISREAGYGQERASAIAAAAGRKKYGATKFQQMAAAGKRRASK